MNYRRKSAAKSLIALLRYSKQKGVDPLSLKGSWGGAIGYIQFMPYNLVYAIDADGDGTINLFNWSDAMYSAANYLKKVGNYNSSLTGRRNAFYKYNPSWSYVDGVILYANTIWDRYNRGY